MTKANSIFKRFTSLVLSLVFVLTTFAAVDFSQSAALTAKAASSEHFLFAYFTGNDSASSSSAYSQAIRFAVSEDGINFTALNDNKPIITQTGGSGSVRDPYLFQGADGYYYMIGTDLDATTMGWWGNQPQMVIWRSADLVHWDHETYINTAQICGLNDNQVYRTWAPEVFYDEATGKYMVYFAFAADGYSSTRMHYMLTDDLLDQSHYSRPQVLYDPGYDDIDSDIIKQGDTYYMFYKDETPGRSSVCLATASALTGPYTFIGQFKTSSATGAIEGCEVYTIGNNYYLVADRFGDNGKFAIYNLGSDLSAVAAASTGENISVEDGNPVSTVNGLTGFQNLSARHGSIIHITKNQYNRLLDFGGADEATGEGVDLSDITLARYLVNDETTDEIGNTDLTERGNPTWENKAFRDRERGAAHFTDGNYLSANVASMLSSNGVASNGFSVSFYGKPDSNNNNQFGRFFEFNDKGIKSSFSWNGNPGQNSVSYVSMWPYESKIEITNYNYDARSWSVSSTYYNSWHHYVATFENGKYCLYIDGAVAYQTNSASMSSNLLSDLCNSGTLLLGQAGWPDAGYTGYMRDFRIYSTALTEAQATKVYRQYALDEEAEDAQAIQDLIDNFDVNNLNKPAFNGTAYHYGNAATGGYTNGTVVYHATNNTDYSNEQDRAYMKLHFYAPKNLVLAYDGTKTLTYPVVFGQKRDGGHSQRIYNVALVSGTNQSLNQNWKGYSDVNNGYSNTNSPWPGVTGSTEINYVNDSSSYIEPNNNNTPRVYGNYITYTGKVNNNNDGSVNTNANFYEKLNSITFRYKGYYSYFGSNTQTLDVTLTGYSVYVLNYKPIYDILDEAKAFYNNNISGKEWMYTTESLVQAMYALSLVANCNPNNYNYSSGVEAEVQKCAADIKTALEEYEAIDLVKKTFNVNFVFDDGAVTSRSITAGETLGALPANSDEKHIDGTSTHNSYSWPEGATADTVVREDTDFEEVTTVESCSFTGEHTAASGAVNGYTTYTCVCGHSYVEYDAQDFTDYTTAYADYEATIGAADYEAHYTAGSRTAYEGAVAAAAIDTTDETISAAAIASAAADITAAKDELAVQNYTISFKNWYSATSTSVVLPYGTSAEDVAAQAPGNTATEYNDARHYTYAWETFTAVTGNKNYIEQRNSNPHSYTSVHTEVDGALNGYTTYTCVCGNSYIEYDAQTKWSEYNDAIDGYDAIIGAEDYETKYTAASRTAYETEVATLFIDVYDETLSDAAIQAAANAINAAQSNLDLVADLSELDKAYAKADALLSNLVGKAAQYDKASVDNLISKVEADGVSTYVNASASERANFGQAVQATVDSLASAINTAYDGLTLAVETAVPETDLSAYEAAVNTLNNLDPDAYDITNASIGSAINGVNEAVGTATSDYDGSTINVVDSSASQANINASTGVILSALTSSIKHYEIVDTSDASVISEISANNGTYKNDEATYGTTMNFRTDDSDTAWFLEIETSTVHKKMAFQGYGRGLSTRVLGKTTVKAVKRSATNNCRIMITRDYSNDDRAPIQYANFVASGYEYTLPAAPAIAYYTFKGYYINGEKYNDATIIIDDDVDIVAKYDLNSGADCAINATDINEEAHNSSVKYNDKVELNGGSGTYAWVEEVGDNEFRPFFIGKDVTLLAAENTTLKAVGKTDFAAYNFSLPCINLRKNGVIISGTKTIFNAQLVAENMDAVQEYGILIGTGNANIGNLNVENSGTHEDYRVIRAKSTKLVGANQFSIAINNLSVDYIYRGYVIYKVGNTLQTAYTDVF